MGIRLPIVLQAKQIPCRSLTNSLPNTNVPKGYLAVYVGEMEKSVSYLNHPSFQDLLRKAEEEFGFVHPMGGLTIPCAEDTFLDLTSQLAVVLQVKQILHRSPINSSLNSNIPKGFFAVHVGEIEKKRFLVPAEEEFGYDHPMGGLTIPCAEDTFLGLTSQLEHAASLPIQYKLALPEMPQLLLFARQKLLINKMK
ncbi:Small auxin-up RNA [Dillenia turbinata]|uniref:Small auxin-up RNA n=1 Tax=Dillenia turbinata TaxID=194707 RepID=A0AAN8YXF8_9MAGN